MNDPCETQAPPVMTGNGRPIRFVPLMDAACVPDAVEDEKPNFGTLKQYTSGDGIRFFPAGDTIPHLQPGVYDILHSHNQGMYFQHIPLATDGLINFPETNSEKVVEEIRKFWTREDAFIKHHLNISN